MPSLVIQSETLRRFAEAQMARADDALVDYLRQRFPDLARSQPDGNLLSTVQSTRANAKRFGVDREDNVATFLDLTVMYPGFPEMHWALDILASDKLHGPDKIALLRDRLRRHGTEL